MSVPSYFRKFLPLGLSYLASGGSLIVSSAAQLLTFAILARALGVDEFSQFIAVTAVTAVAIQICGLGAQEALVRRVAREPQLYPVFLGHNLLLVGVSGAVLMVLGLAILPMLFPLSDELWINLGLFALLLVANIVLARLVLLAEQIFIAHSNFAAANRNVLVFALGRLAAAILACLVFGADTLAEWIVWSFFAHVAIALMSIRSVRPLGLPQFVLRWEEVRNGLLFSTPFILRALRQNLDLLLLTALTTAETVASYALARRIIDSGFLSVEALNRLLYPGSAAATREGLHLGLRRFYRTLGAVVVIALCAAIAIIVLAPVLPVLFGAEYVSLQRFVRILAPTIVLMAIWVTAQEALGSSGHHLHRASLSNGMVILGAALVALGTWLYGVNGTFVATYVTELITGIACWFVLLRLVDQHRRGVVPSQSQESVSIK